MTASGTRQVVQKATAAISDATATGRIAIESVYPTVEDGRFAARAVIGQRVRFAAVAFREGHDKIGVNLLLTPPKIKGAGRKTNAPILVPMVPGEPGTDEWLARASAGRPGAWTFCIEAWSDPIATWRYAVSVKLAAGQDAAELANDIAHGVRLLSTAAEQIPSAQRKVVTLAAKVLADATTDLGTRVGAALAPEVTVLLDRHPVRELLTRSETYRLWVDRPRAAVGAWYEFFPRSTGGVDATGRPVHGTFGTAIDALPRIAEMGFDVVYLPPIHPIGEVNRKGPNNTLDADPDDVGSPWAIGSAAGGHDAVHPDLGTLADFDRFVSAAGDLGLEVALDFALQCAPDHPWVTAHPEWFTTLADGTIAYAENPPKKYQDIYPLNFDNDPAGLYAEILRVVLHWVEHGVRIFRVDNPHTKPMNFWHWLIAQVKKIDPDVVFLAEAFTRPAVMNGLGKRGFSQSYTYFTWRTTRDELEEFGRDLGATAPYFNPNLFVNTPDILHETLQYGGPPMFKIRAVLAAMMASSWGVYSGYEIFEHVAVRPGSEEYLDSEKYQLRPRDYSLAQEQGRSLEGYIANLNRIRHAYPALATDATDIYFHGSDNDQVIVFSRHDPRSGDAVLVICSLDSVNTQRATIDVSMPALGLDWTDRFDAYDEISGASWDWGQFDYVELSPFSEPAHIVSVRPRRAVPPVDGSTT